MGKKSKSSELGRALAKKQERVAKSSRFNRRTAEAQTAEATGRHTSNENSSNLQSVLDATDLEELMLNATLANEDFTAQRYPGPLAPQTVVVTPFSYQSENQTSAERDVRRELDRTALRIPRRPPWNASTTYKELMVRETDEFLKWRRRIATTEEEHSLAATIGGPMMTPFEKNLEVWRQLWRVVERSDVIIQIVDARNPLLYYCEDMYRYVTEEMQRAHLLVLNKSDLLSSKMIGKWETYFTSKNIDVAFFSAFKASVNEETDDKRVVGAHEFIEKLGKYERKTPQTRENQRIVVGMCGYPNVGKSSTINVLLETVAVVTHSDEEASQVSVEDGVSDAHELEEQSLETAQSESIGESGKKLAKDGKPTKRVAVSSTPGKTKHFQTLVLTDDLLLCDCPGLVFPNFSSSKAELICAGVLSIDQMRGDHLTPVSLIASRIPAATLEGVYGIRFAEAVDGVLTEMDASQRALPGFVSGSVLLETHARARGYMSDHNKADTSRSARVLLKDYVSGRIIYVHGPNGDGESGVGPAVFAKKGTLVYERNEAWASADGNPQGAEKREVTEGDESAKDNVVKAAKVRFDMGENKTEEVRAIVSKRKKEAASEFVRVERSFYPEWWGK